jgi:hypothetical protein
MPGGHARLMDFIFDHFVCRGEGRADLKITDDLRPEGFDPEAPITFSIFCPTCKQSIVETIPGPEFMKESDADPDMKLYLSDPDGFEVKARARIAARIAQSGKRKPQN